MDTFKSTYKTLDDGEKKIFKEILSAVIKDNGHKDFFYGGDTDEQSQFKMEIIRTIDQLPTDNY